MSTSLLSENKIAESALSPVVLECRDLSKAYPMPKGQSYVVLENLNLSITQGEFISIIGHSGCGKSTLLSMIAGLNPISGGSILLNGAPIKGPGPDRGVIFQSPSLLPWMSALENVLLGVNQVFSHESKATRPWPRISDDAAMTWPRPPSRCTRKSPVSSTA